MRRCGRRRLYILKAPTASAAALTWARRLPFSWKMATPAQAAFRVVDVDVSGRCLDRATIRCGSPLLRHSSKR
jgi:hypothetical protein